MIHLFFVLMTIVGCGLSLISLFFWLRATCKQFAHIGFVLVKMLLQPGERTLFSKRWQLPVLADRLPVSSHAERKEGEEA